MATKLTLILCNYNHSAYLPRAIESVVSQSRLPDEYIIVDDGSTDNSLEIIQRYARQYPFIKVIAKPTNTGNLDARRVASRVMTGDFFHLGAADDYMLPGFLEQVSNAANLHPDAGIICSSHYIEDHLSGKWIAINRASRWNVSEFISPTRYHSDYLMVDDACSTVSPATFYSRRVWDEIGDYPDTLQMWDVSFFLQYGALKWGCYYIPIPYYVWVYNPGGWTAKSNQDLEKSLTTFVNYYFMMRRAPYNHYFRPEFAERWLSANTGAAVNRFLAAELEKCSKQFSSGVVNEQMHLHSR